MRLINLTPDVLVIHRRAGEPLRLPPSGQVARSAEVRREIGVLVTRYGLVPVFETRMGRVEGVPDPRRGVVYVTSAMVAEATLRPDVMSPGRLVRDSEGRPRGCEGLRKWPVFLHGMWGEE